MILIFQQNVLQEHCVKSVQIQSYFWSVFSCIRSEYRKIRTRNNSTFGEINICTNVFGCFFSMLIAGMKKKKKKMVKLLRELR